MSDADPSSFSSMLTLFWAYLAGALTLINPCVLPLLPITIAAAFQSNRYGPLILAGGLVASFTIVGVGVTAPQLTLQTTQLCSAQLACARSCPRPEV